MQFYEPFFGYYFFNALLFVLQLLHIYWAYLILRMVCRFAFVGKVRREAVYAAAIAGNEESDG